MVDNAMNNTNALLREMLVDPRRWDSLEVFQAEAQACIRRVSNPRLKDVLSAVLNVNPRASKESVKTRFLEEVSINSQTSVAYRCCITLYYRLRMLGITATQSTKEKTMMR